MEGTKVMDNEVYKAAVKGDSTVLDNGSVSGDECTVTKANILHIAVRHEQYDFMEIALRKFPHVVCQRNCDNNTPFHIAAEIGNTRILELLVNCYNKTALEGVVPWRVKNSKGNTPLHVALIFANLQFAQELVIIDPQLTAFLNDSGETPLHLAIRYRVTNDDRESVLKAMKLMITSNPGGIYDVQSPPKENSGRIITLLLEKNSSVACLRDLNGLTPLLRAASFKMPDMSAIGSMLKDCPQSIEGENLHIPWIKIDKEKEKLQNLVSKLREGGIIREFADTDDEGMGNVLHKLIDVLWLYDVPEKLALEDDQVQEFMKEALDSHPALICETNEDGQTPLHQIAYYFPDFIDESVLRMFKRYFIRFEGEYGVEGLYLPPWRMKDEDGDTPLHTALICGASLRCLREFLELDHELATYQNNEMETLLHLLSYVDLSPKSFEEAKDLISGGASGSLSRVACHRNEEGLTPLLKAAREANIPLVKLLYILNLYNVNEKTENEKKTFWHLLANQTPFDSTDDTESGLEMLLEMRNNEEALKCLAEADTDGNTPLHIAIEKKNFQFARFVMEITPEDSLKNIMRKRNKKDLSPTDLIGSAEDVSPQLKVSKEGFGFSGTMRNWILKSSAPMSNL